MRASLADLPAEYQEQARAQLGDVTKVGKFRNVVVEVGGIRFDSKWEARRWEELRAQESAGLITALAHHVPFPLHVVTPDGERVRVGAYEADFTYLRAGELAIEDTKSLPTRRHPLYRWKAAHFEAEYGRKITEVMRVKRSRRIA